MEDKERYEYWVGQCKKVEMWSEKHKKVIRQLENLGYFIPSGSSSFIGGWWEGPGVYLFGDHIVKHFQNQFTIVSCSKERLLEVASSLELQLENIFLGEPVGPLHKQQIKAALETGRTGLANPNYLKSFLS